MVITARIRRMTEGNAFTLSTIAGVEGGTTIPTLVRSQEGGRDLRGKGGVPPHPWMGWGVPLSRSDPMGAGGTPYGNSIVCTYYAVGGMPLAFTQEDFLVRTMR